MRVLAAIACAPLVLCALAAAASSASAEWVRVPIGASEASGIPATWDRLERRVERDYTVSWSNEARWDPNYTWNAGATVGTMSVVNAAGVTIELTWLEFETAAAAEEYAQMMLSSWGVDSYYQVRAEGTRVITAYPYDYTIETSTAVLEDVAGR